MPTRLHKNRKCRGSVSAGHGRIGKHRKHPGGRGNAGTEHHHRINTFKYHPGYIGKHGMRRFHDVGNKLFCKTVNVFDIWGILSEEEKKTIMERQGTVPTVDLSLMGIHKVLGNGPTIPYPMVLKARYFSKLAQEKIEQAGGKCIAFGTPKKVVKPKASA